MQTLTNCGFSYDTLHSHFHLHSFLSVSFFFFFCLFSENVREDAR